MAGGAGSSIGRGGMIKVLAAKRAAGSGTSTVIAWGREPDVLLRLAAASAIGTAGGAARRSWRRASSGWSTTCRCAGAVVVDDGAGCAKLRDEGKSLLPIGVIARCRASSSAAT